MLTTIGRDVLLADLIAAYPYVGLLKGVTNWRAGTVTEAAYTGYSIRPLATWGGAADTSPTAGRQIANAAAVTFPQNTGSTEAQIGFGMYAGDTGGTPGAISFLDAKPPVLATAESAGDTFTAPGHGLSTDHLVFALACPGGVIPTGLTENTTYYVLASGLTSDVLKLSTSSGGAAVNVTAYGAVLLIPYTPVNVVTLTTPQFAIASLTVQL